MATCSAMFIAKLVLPMPGRAATFMRALPRSKLRSTTPRHVSRQVWPQSGDAAQKAPGTIGGNPL
jgi:hypothetical protein